MSDIEIALISLIGIISIVFVFLSIQTNIKKRTLQNLINEKTEKLKVKSVEKIAEDYQVEIDELEIKLGSGSKHYNNISKELNIFIQLVTRIKVGLLPPVFKFDDSENLKERIAECHINQFELINSGESTSAFSDWSWFNSKEKGRQVVNAYRGLLLKAYNAEFDFIRKQMRYSTYDTALNKLERLGEQLEKLGETANVAISSEYIYLKERELEIWYDELDHKEKIKQERKKQQKLLREQSKLSGPDTDEIEDEIFIRKAMLKKAQEIAQEKSGVDHATIDLQIRTIQQEIEDLNKKFERAQSQAQITRAGYVYVISNIGSFGNGIVKIGMTRRLEPLDRVKELGDASVPFKFDVHTLAFVDNAPSIEKKLHNAFNQTRVNADNPRKEFFKVTAEQVKTEMVKLDIESDWFFDVEAKEYRESLLIRESLSKQVMAQAIVSEDFPETI